MEEKLNCCIALLIRSPNLTPHSNRKEKNKLGFAAQTFDFGARFF